MKVPAIANSAIYLKEMHKKFYDFLPQDFSSVKTKEGKIKEVIPEEFRDNEVEVGRHVAPHFKKLDAFVERFENVYDSKANVNKSKTKRLISISSSHHRLAWIHRFLDGNGRVVRLFSDACFMYENPGALSFGQKD